MPSTPLLKALAGELNTDQNTLQQSLLGGDESLTPNYFYVDASGQVHAVFTGGIDILANQSSFSVNNHVAWRETVPGGAMVAEIAGYKGVSSFPNEGLVLATPSVGASGNNTASIRIDNGGTTPTNELIQLNAGGNVDTLLRGDGWSQFKYVDVVNTNTIIGGPTFPGASNTVIAGTYTFSLGTPWRALCTFDSIIQHNGVAGTTYTLYVWVLIDAVSYYFGSVTMNNSTWNLPLSGAVVSQQLNAGSHSVTYFAVESASPSLGIYDWSFSVGLLPLAFPDGVTQ